MKTKLNNLTLFHKSLLREIRRVSRFYSLMNKELAPFPTEYQLGKLVGLRAALDLLKKYRKKK